MSEDEKENEKIMQHLNERSRLIASARKDVDQLLKDVEIQGAKIEVVRKQILEFGKKKLSDLMN